MTKKHFSSVLTRAGAMVMTAVMTVAGAFIWNVSEASATSVQDKKDQISSYEEKIKAAESKVSSLKGDMSKTKDYITELDAQISDYEAQIQLLQSDIDAYQKDIDALQADINQKNAQIKELNEKIEANIKEIENLKAEIEKQKDELKTQVRNIYMSGETSSLEVLLCSKDFSDFLIKQQYVSSLADYEQSLIDSINATVKQIHELNEQIEDQTAKIETARAEVAKQQSEVKDKQAVVKGQQAEVDSKQAIVESKRNDANSQLNALAASKDKYQSSIEQYEKDIKALESQIQKELANRGSTGSGSLTGGGKLQWPLHYSGCYISSGMVGRTNPVTGRSETHGGIDICVSGGSYGKAISAAAAGTVITASYHYSYGNYVMIDHGNGLATLYAHCSSLAVGAGQSVSAGQTIAYVGDTGYVSGPHLHFEVRVNGQRTNPLGYVSMP